MSPDRIDIERALKDAGGNIGRAAELLRTSRRTLQNRMRSYGMARGRGGRPKRALKYRGRRASWAAAGAAIGLAAIGALALSKKSGA